jgi:hypothetical protein
MAKKELNYQQFAGFSTKKEAMWSFIAFGAFKNGDF